MISNGVFREIAVKREIANLLTNNAHEELFGTPCFSNAQQLEFRETIREAIREAIFGHIVDHAHGARGSRRQFGRQFGRQFERLQNHCRIIAEPLLQPFILSGWGLSRPGRRVEH